MQNNTLELNDNDFKSLIVEISNFSEWNEFCKNNFNYSTYISMSIEERKNCFNEFVSDSSAIDLIDQDYWQGIFFKKPIFENNIIKGFEKI